jgi:hypothetical protein
MLEKVLDVRERMVRRFEIIRMISRELTQSLDSTSDIVDELRVLRPLQLVDDLLDMLDYPLGWKLDRTLVLRFSGLHLRPFFELRLNLFATVEQALDRSRSRILIESVKDALDRAYDDMQRHSAILPCLDHRPVYGAKKQVLPAPADECLFDLGEVIVVVQGSSQWSVVSGQWSVIPEIAL